MSSARAHRSRRWKESFSTSSKESKNGNITSTAIGPQSAAISRGSRDKASPSTCDQRRTAADQARRDRLPEPAAHSCEKIGNGQLVKCRMSVVRCVVYLSKRQMTY